MDSKITIQQKVLDGTQTGPVHAELILPDMVGEVSIEDSLLDRSGSEINIEVSDTLGVTGIGDLLEVKNSIDDSVNRVEQSISESQKQIDKANDVLNNLNQETEGIKRLVDQAQTAANTATNKASAAGTSAQAAKTSETNAKASADISAKNKDAAALSAAMAADSESKAKNSENVANLVQQEALATETRIRTIKSEVNSDLINAQAAKAAAELARDAAKLSETNSKTSETNAKTSETNAKQSEIKAEAAQTKAETAATTVQQLELSTKNSASTAVQATKSAESARDTTAQLQLAAKQSADNAKTSETNAKTSETNAKTSETNAKTSETNAKQSETDTKLSEQRTKVSEDKAELSATNAEKYKEAAALSAGVAKTNADTSINKAKEATAATQEAEKSKVAAKLSEDNAKLSEVAAEEWATSKPNNNARYWAEKAKEYSAKTIVNGGAWTPSAGNEYPDTTGITIDTIWKVSFPNRGDKYTYTGGAFAGQEVKALDEIMYDMPTGTWALFKSDSSGGITTIKTPLGGSETTAEVEITPQKLGALTKAQGDALYLGLTDSAATANKLQTAFKLILDGDATGTVSIDGSGDVILSVVVHDDSHNHVIDNIDGLQDILTSKVDSSRTINGKPLTANINLTAGDIGALAAGTPLFSGSWNDLADKPATFPPNTHGHTWGQITEKPAFATRWAKWSEITEKPNVAIQNALAKFTDIVINNGIFNALTGVWTKGLLFKDALGTNTLGGIGSKGNGNNLQEILLGFGSDWANGTTGLKVTPTELKYNGEIVYHKGNMPDLADLDVYSKTESNNRFLTKDGKAADSQKLGGIDSNRFIYGMNESATMLTSDFNVNRKSGMIEMDSRVNTNKPGRANSWVWGWQTAHTNNANTRSFGAQMVVSQDGNMYFRLQNQDGTGTWRKPYHDGNIPTAADVGALPASTKAEDIGGRSDTWTPDWNDVRNKPSTFPPSAHNHDWTQVTNKPDVATRWPDWGEVTGKPGNLLDRATADTLYFKGTEIAESSAMKTFYSPLGGKSDSQDSPISIRERGKVGTTNTADTYAPNLNFNWDGVTSKSLWLDKDGTVHVGGYDASGVPQTDGGLAVKSLTVAGNPVSTSVDFHYQEASSTVVVTRQSYNTVVVLGNGTHTVSVDTTDFKAGDKITVVKARANKTNTTVSLANGGVIMAPNGGTNASAYFTGAGRMELTRVTDTGNFYITDLNEWGNK